MKILFLGILVSTQCLAWGPTGHRAVGEIAQRFLDIKVLVKVLKLSKGQSLSRVATWADEIKSDPTNYSNTFNWHYTDWPSGMHDHNEEHSSGILLTSIADQIEILKNEQTSDDKKAAALKFLVHLVGDLHMPLHVGNGQDLGGNTCKVLFHNNPTNLHALWDEGMINATKLSFTELATFVSQGREIELIRQWKTGSIVDWARESKELREKLYPNMPARKYCVVDATLGPDELPNLGYAYSYEFLPKVDQRLYQAGLRLAVLLNSALN